MTTTLTQQSLTPSQRQAFALGLTVALKMPVQTVWTDADGPFSYRCPECGGTATGLTDAELRQMEMDGMCGECDSLCKTCGGDGEYVRGEDVYPCGDCAGRRANR